MTAEDTLTVEEKRQLLTASVLLVAILVAVAVHTNVQFGKLVGLIELSESHMEMRVDEANRAVNDRNIPNLTRSKQQAMLQIELAVNSEKYERKMVLVGKAIQDISLLPWNFAGRKLKNSYLLHNEAQIEYLKSKSGYPSFSTEIDVSFDLFCIQVTTFSPLLALGRFDTRLTRICLG